jgi:YjbE family integral membrane protein
MDALTTWFSAIQWAQLQWSSVGQIILFDILLGGDNAIVIALACRGLPPAQRLQGVLWGAAGAIMLRVLLVAFAVGLLDLPGVKLVGALLLLWIGVKLLLPEGDGEHDVDQSSHLMGAVKTIILADLVMSVDNVLAIAGAASQAPPAFQMYYVVFGLLVSIPFIVAGSQLVLGLLDRFPFLITCGGAMLGYIAGKMIVTDPWVNGYMAVHGQAEVIAGAIGATFVVALARVIVRAKSCQASRPN